MTPSFWNEPRTAAGCQMPSGRAIVRADDECRFSAEEGSRQLLEAIKLYLSRHQPGVRL
jgi:hypothetical protein